MVTPEFSYWLTVTPRETYQRYTLDKMLKILEMGNLGNIGGDGLHFRIEGNSIIGEVDPDVGTMPENEDIFRHTAQEASEYPEFDFELQECNEEDRSNGTTTKWSGGKKVYEGSIRTVPSDRQYDAFTVKAITECLSCMGLDNIVEVIKERFDC